MRMSDSVTTVLFDLDGTLLNHDAAAAAAVHQWASECGLPENPSYPLLWKKLETKWFSAYERGETTHLGQRAGRAREFLGRPSLSEAEALRLYDAYLSAYADNWIAFPDALPALQGALNSGRTVGILTNGARDMQAAKLEATGLNLPGVTLLPTVELGAPKPDPKAYDAALHIMGSSPSQTLMIGDNVPNDVLAARACGLSAIYLNRNGDSADVPADPADVPADPAVLPADPATIHSLSELIWS